MHKEKQSIREQHGEKRTLKKQAMICVGKIRDKIIRFVFIGRHKKKGSSCAGRAQNELPFLVLSEDN